MEDCSFHSCPCWVVLFSLTESKCCSLSCCSLLLVQKPISQLWQLLQANQIRDICRSLWRTRKLHVEKLRSTDGVTSYISAATPDMTVLSHLTTDPTQTVKEQQITQQLHHWLPCTPYMMEHCWELTFTGHCVPLTLPDSEASLLGRSLEEDLEINVKFLEILTGVCHI